jgi:hypothetical protein
MPKPVVLPSTDGPHWAGVGRVRTTRHLSPSCTLDLSRSRTHDAALDILKAYKLTGNFYCNLETVLKDMGLHDMVTYQIELNPRLAFPDCRCVVFSPNEDLPGDTFGEIIRSIKARIGFETPWWVGLLRRAQGGTG